MICERVLQQREQHLWEKGEKYADSWNFGPVGSNIKTVEWIAESFVQIWQEELKIKIESNNKLPEMQNLILDSTKAKTHLGWRQQWNLNKALEKTAEWYKAFQRKEDLNNLTLDQIKTFNKDLSRKNSDLVNV